MPKFRPTFAREQKRRTRTRAVTAVTERRRARRAAREKCRAEQRRLKTWIPEERKRVAGAIVQLQAQGQQQIAQLRAQVRELIKGERDALTKRIAKARADAKLGRCVDLTAGPAIFNYAYPKRPPHLRTGGQQGLFAGAPVHSGGKLGDPYRVRGVQYANEKRALAAVRAHLVHDQGGIVVLEQWNGAQYVDGALYGLEGEGKAAKLVELDPLDPRGHETERAKRALGGAFGGRIPTILPSARPAPMAKQTARDTRKPPTFDRAAALERAQAFPGLHRLPPRELEAARALVKRSSAAAPVKGTKPRKPKGKIKPRPKGTKAPPATPKVARPLRDRARQAFAAAERAAAERPQYAGAGPTTGTTPRMLPSSRPKDALLRGAGAAADRALEVLRNERNQRAARPAWAPEWNALGFKIAYQFPQTELSKTGRYAPDSPEGYWLDWSTGGHEFHTPERTYAITPGTGGNFKAWVLPWRRDVRLGPARTFAQAFATLIDLHQQVQESPAGKPRARKASAAKAPKVKPRAGSPEAIEAGAARLIATKFKERPGADFPYRVFFEDGHGDRVVVAQRKTRESAKGAAQTLANKYGQPRIYGWFVSTEKGWGDVQATGKPGERRFWVGR